MFFTAPSSFAVLDSIGAFIIPKSSLTSITTALNPFLSTISRKPLKFAFIIPQLTYSACLFPDLLSFSARYPVIFLFIKRGGLLLLPLTNKSAGPSFLYDPETSFSKGDTSIFFKAGLYSYIDSVVDINILSLKGLMQCMPSRFSSLTGIFTGFQFFQSDDSTRPRPKRYPE